MKRNRLLAASAHCFDKGIGFARFNPVLAAESVGAVQLASGATVRFADHFANQPMRASVVTSSGFNLLDLASFVACLGFSGPGDITPIGCTVDFDVDFDNDVDLKDFSTFQRNFTLATKPEAIYVDRLILHSGSQVILENVNIYCHEKTNEVGDDLDIVRLGNGNIVLMHGPR